MNTPWGESQFIKTVVPGVLAVETAGHGGFLVEFSTDRYPSSRGQDIGLLFGQYLCFEEDCDYAVLLYEMPEANWNSIFKRKHTSLECKEEGRKTLFLYHPGYFEEIEDKTASSSDLLPKSPIPSKTPLRAFSRMPELIQRHVVYWPKRSFP